MNTHEQKSAIKYLEGKGLSNGDMVSFRVENQNLYIGPTHGELYLKEGKDPYILCQTDKGFFKMSINNYLGAYIGTIKKLPDNRFRVLEILREIDG